MHMARGIVTVKADASISIQTAVVNHAAGIAWSGKKGPEKAPKESAQAPARHQRGHGCGAREGQ